MCCNFLISFLLLDVSVMYDIFAIKNAEMYPLFRVSWIGVPLSPNLGQSDVAQEFWNSNWDSGLYPLNSCAMPETAVLVWAWVGLGKSEGKGTEWEGDIISQAQRTAWFPGGLGETQLYMRPYPWVLCGTPSCVCAYLPKIALIQILSRNIVSLLHGWKKSTQVRRLKSLQVVRTDHDHSSVTQQ